MGFGFIRLICKSIARGDGQGVGAGVGVVVVVGWVGWGGGGASVKVKKTAGLRMDKRGNVPVSE